MEVGDDAFWDGEGTPLLSSPQRAEWLEGRDFWISGRMREDLLKRVREGRQGPLRETGRFDVHADREIRCAVDGAFDLRFTASPSRGDRVSAAYRFAWSGGKPVEGLVSFSALESTSAFLRAKGNGRYDLVMFAVHDLKP